MSACRPMAVSATPRTAEISGVASPSSLPLIAVAYSGGRDSTALLHVTACAAREQGLGVLALHVHHGLSAHADAWLAHCQAQCEAWAAEGLPLMFRHAKLAGRPAVGQSIEAWAREGRYAALAEMSRAAGVDLLLLAQHRRDQAETLLLQALRGAGVAGLAGMPARQWRDGILWARPWLAQPREAIETYLHSRGLNHIEDDSNEEARYARNRLRLSAWPALATAFPQAEASLAQAAAWAQQALILQQEVAELDLAGLADADGLDADGLACLSPARASNALRAWLQAQLGQAAPASLVQRLLIEGPRSGAACWPCVGGQIYRYRGRLQFVPQREAFGAGPVVILDLSRPGLYPVPMWQGAWSIEDVTEGGIEPSLLARVEMRARQGGEQFQSHPKGMPRSLKKAYQSAALPAWQRRGPLLLVDELLLYAPGLGLDARVLAAPGLRQLGLRWQTLSVPMP